MGLRSHEAQLPANAEPMPAILVIPPGANQVEQNPAETVLSEIALHKMPGRWLCRFQFSHAGRRRQLSAGSPNGMALESQ